MGQPGFNRTGIISFYIFNGVVGFPMSGWLQTYVNNEPVARFGRYV